MEYSLQALISVLFFCFILLFIFFVNPNNKWNLIKFCEPRFTHYIIIFITLVVTVLLSVMPMSLSPYWNGTLHELSDKQQYDRMGDALLQGHLYIDNGDIDPALQTMKNPYDKAEREKLGVKYNWDEAYYNHHYYMYFGVVPTIILFIPFKLVTGIALLSYQATQVFATLTIIGLFYLFYLLCSFYFTSFPFSLYLLLSSSFSIISIGYSIAAPALYCTAIVSGICLMVWSFVCFLKFKLSQESNNSGNIYLFLGALLGAFAFGCRPPVALANAIVLPVICAIFQYDYHNRSEKIKKMLLVLFPYVIVGLILMLYNYARFDNIFEFGQSYQLTLADQHNYRSVLEHFDFRQVLTGFWLNLYAPCGLSDSFPYLRFNGFFINYPILLLVCKVFAKPVASLLKKRKLYSCALVVFVTSFLIVLLDVYWSPFLSKRYHLDFLYLLCIATFLAIAAWLETVTDKKRKFLLAGIIVLAFYVFVAELLFFCIPFDGNYAMYYPEKINEIYKGLRFGL